MKHQSISHLFDLNEKTALVTGGAGILGEQFCHALAEFGANVAIVDKDIDKARELADALASQHGVKSMAWCADVTSTEAVHDAIEAISNVFGSIDVLLNNAAGKSDKIDDFFAPFENYKEGEWKSIMSSNIDSMFYVAQAVGRQMIRQGSGGSIIQTSSIYGLLAPDNRIYKGAKYLGVEINTPAVYSASKAAVIGLTKYLSSYWAQYKIRVNTITPGGVFSGQNRAFVENYSDRVPLGRMAERHELSGAIIYLASDASSYVTGQNIVVDGGLSAW